MITIGILRCREGTAVGIADIAGIIFVMALTSSCVFGHWKDIDIDVVGIDIGIVGIVGMLVVVVRMKWNGQCGQWRIGELEGNHIHQERMDQPLRSKFEKSCSRDIPS